jgi:hypothetical protein
MEQAVSKLESEVESQIQLILRSQAKPLEVITRDQLQDRLFQSEQHAKKLGQIVESNKSCLVKVKVFVQNQRRDFQTIADHLQRPPPKTPDFRREFDQISAHLFRELSLLSDFNTNAFQSSAKDVQFEAEMRNLKDRMAGLFRTANSRIPRNYVELKNNVREMSVADYETLFQNSTSKIEHMFFENQGNYKTSQARLTDALQRIDQRLRNFKSKQDFEANSVETQPKFDPSEREALLKKVERHKSLVKEIYAKLKTEQASKEVLVRRFHDSFGRLVDIVDSKLGSLDAGSNEYAEICSERLGAICDKIAALKASIKTKPQPSLSETRHRKSNTDSAAHAQAPHKESIIEEHVAHYSSGNLVNPMTKSRSDSGVRHSKSSLAEIRNEKLRKSKLQQLKNDIEHFRKTEQKKIDSVMGEIKTIFKKIRQKKLSKSSQIVRPDPAPKSPVRRSVAKPKNEDMTQGKQGSQSPFPTTFKLNYLTEFINRDGLMHPSNGCPMDHPQCRTPKRPKAFHTFVFQILNVENTAPRHRHISFSERTPRLDTPQPGILKSQSSPVKASSLDISQTISRDPQPHPSPNANSVNANNNKSQIDLTEREARRLYSFLKSKIDGQRSDVVDSRGEPSDPRKVLYSYDSFSEDSNIARADNVFAENKEKEDPDTTFKNINRLLNELIENGNQSKAENATKMTEIHTSTQMKVSGLIAEQKNLKKELALKDRLLDRLIERLGEWTRDSQIRLAKKTGAKITTMEDRCQRIQRKMAKISEKLHFCCTKAKVRKSQAMRWADSCYEYTHKKTDDLPKNRDLQDLKSDYKNSWLAYKQKSSEIVKKTRHMSLPSLLLVNAKNEKSQISTVELGQAHKSRQLSQTDIQMSYPKNVRASKERISFDFPANFQGAPLLDLLSLKKGKNSELKVDGKDDFHFEILRHKKTLEESKAGANINIFETFKFDGSADGVASPLISCSDFDPGPSQNPDDFKKQGPDSDSRKKKPSSDISEFAVPKSETREGGLAHNTNLFSFDPQVSMSYQDLQEENGKLRRLLIEFIDRNRRIKQICLKKTNLRFERVKHLVKIQAEYYEEVLAGIKALKLAELKEAFAKNFKNKNFEPKIKNEKKMADLKIVCQSPTQKVPKILDVVSTGQFCRKGRRDLKLKDVYLVRQEGCVRSCAGSQTDMESRAKAQFDVVIFSQKASQRSENGVQSQHEINRSCETLPLICSQPSTHKVDSLHHLVSEREGQIQPPLQAPQHLPHEWAMPAPAVIFFNNKRPNRWEIGQTVWQTPQSKNRKKQEKTVFEQILGQKHESFRQLSREMTSLQNLVMQPPMLKNQAPARSSYVKIDTPRDSMFPADYMKETCPGMYPSKIEAFCQTDISCASESCQTDPAQDLALASGPAFLYLKRFERQSQSNYGFAQERPKRASQIAAANSFSKAKEQAPDQPSTQNYTQNPLLVAKIESLNERAAALSDLVDQKLGMQTNVYIGNIIRGLKSLLKRNPNQPSVRTDSKKEDWYLNDSVDLLNDDIDLKNSKFNFSEGPAPSRPPKCLPGRRISQSDNRDDVDSQMNQDMKASTSSIFKKEAEQEAHRSDSVDYPIDDFGNLVFNPKIPKKFGNVNFQSFIQPKTPRRDSLKSDIGPKMVVSKTPMESRKLRVSPNYEYVYAKEKRGLGRSPVAVPQIYHRPSGVAHENAQSRLVTPPYCHFTQLKTLRLDRQFEVSPNSILSRPSVATRSPRPSVIREFQQLFNSRVQTSTVLSHTLHGIQTTLTYTFDKKPPQPDPKDQIISELENGIDEVEKYYQNIISMNKKKLKSSGIKMAKKLGEIDQKSDAKIRDLAERVQRLEKNLKSAKHSQTSIIARLTETPVRVDNPRNLLSPYRPSMVNPNALEDSQANSALLQNSLNDIHAGYQRIVELQSKLAVAEEKISERENQISNLKNQKNTNLIEYENKMTMATNKIKDLLTINSQLEKQIDALKSNLKKSDMKVQLADSMKQADDLARELAIHKEQYNSLQLDKEEIESNFKNLNLQTSSIIAEKSNLTTELEKARAASRKSQADLESKTMFLAGLATAIERAVGFQPTQEKMAEIEVFLKKAGERKHILDYAKAAVEVKLGRALPEEEYMDLVAQAMTTWINDLDEKAIRRKSQTGK